MQPPSSPHTSTLEADVEGFFLESASAGSGPTSAERPDRRLHHQGFVDDPPLEIIPCRASTRLSSHAKLIIRWLVPRARAMMNSNRARLAAEIDPGLLDAM